MRVESTCIRQIKKKTGATIFLNRMGLPLVVPPCGGGGRSTRRNLCAAAAVLVVLAHTRTAIDTNDQAMRIARRCESPGDANGNAKPQEGIPC